MPCTRRKTSHPGPHLVLVHAGLRTRFVNDSWGLETYLLALRLFDPGPDMTDELEQVSAILKEWVGAVLHEYDITLADIFATSTDSGSDVKRCVRAAELMNLPWEWCGTHLINRAEVEGLGHSETARGTKKPSACKLIMSVNQVVHHVKKSPKTSVRGSGVTACA